MIVPQIQESGEFESLCADDQLCVHMIKNIEQETGLELSTLEEYLERKIEPEQEVLKYLDQNK